MDYDTLIQKTEWYKILHKYKHIVVFGANETALNTYHFIEYVGGRDIECFIVSKKGTNPDYLANKVVKTFEEISQNVKENALVIVSQSYDDYCNMQKILFEAGFKNIFPSNLQMTTNISHELKKYCCNILDGLNIVDEFTSQNQKICINSELSTSIYAVTSHHNKHIQKNNFESKYIYYIQAGSALTDCKICDYQDNVGSDNISHLNSFFCELTAGYWIYKNDNCSDYIGLYHYSRGLDMTDKQIETIISANVDVVLPVPCIFRHEIITKLRREYVAILNEAIHKVSPEYDKTVENYYMSKVFFPGNIVFCKRQVFDEYYKWMFDIFHEYIEIQNNRKIKPYTRQYGYVAEALTNIYFRHNLNKYFVLYSKIKFQF